MQTWLVLLSLLAVCTLAFADEATAAAAATKWVNDNVNCNDDLDCNVTVTRSRRSATTTTTTSDNANDDGTAVTNAECPKLAEDLDEKKGFSLTLITNTFNDTDFKDGKKDDVLTGTQPRLFVKAVQLLESCLLWKKQRDAASSG